MGSMEIGIHTTYVDQETNKLITFLLFRFIFHYFSLFWICSPKQYFFYIKFIVLEPYFGTKYKLNINYQLETWRNYVGKLSTHKKIIIICLKYSHQSPHVMLPKVMVYSNPNFNLIWFWIYFIWTTFHRNSFSADNNYYYAKAVSKAKTHISMLSI